MGAYNLSSLFESCCDEGYPHPHPPHPHCISTDRKINVRLLESGVHVHLTSKGQDKTSRGEDTITLIISDTEVKGQRMAARTHLKWGKG